MDIARALQQHRALREALRGCGATLEVLEFVHGAYDSVFTKDMALLFTRDKTTRALAARPRYAERQRECLVRSQALSRLGFSVQRPETYLEGGDVVVLPGGAGALLGHGFRSEVGSAYALARLIDAPVTAIELVDPRLFHLDMAVTSLDDGTLLVCQDAMTEASFRAIVRLPSVQRVVTVSLADALAFGLNMVQVGDSIVGSLGSDVVVDAIERRGYHAVRVCLDQFHRAGGSAACLVARVHDLDAVTVRRRDRAAPAATRLGGT